MSEGDDLLGKADALLSRYRSPPLPDFPVLTEVVELPVKPADTVKTDSATTVATAAPEVISQQIEIPGPVASAAPPAPISNAVDGELHDLEDQLRQRILNAIEPRLDALLGASLEQRIRTELDAAMDGFATSIVSAIRTEAGDLVQRAVTEAVEHEFSKLRASLSDS